jgi:hypothetical protein
LPDAGQSQQIIHQITLVLERHSTESPKAAFPLDVFCPSSLADSLLVQQFPETPTACTG